jgi:lycopene beta-cyclase
MDKYDYIITGAGAAGLSLLIHMIDSGKFTGKKILLVDREPKTQNDRTWCFWEEHAGAFEEIVYKRWSSMWFYDRQHSALHDISPYQYKLIRGIDFYNYCNAKILTQKNVSVQFGKVENCVSNDAGTYVLVDGKKIFSEYIFNSIVFEQLEASREMNYLLQHFKGWMIETSAPVFDEQRATLMDFRVDQEQGDTTFVYVMPFSETRALVEFTMFSDKILPDGEYDAALKEYCVKYLGIEEYTILETEFGVIPMTDHHFDKQIHNLINIGTAGGQTKPSSGYTFNFIQKNSRSIVEALIATGKPFVRENISDRRFRLYDRTLLEILSRRSFQGDKIFSILMRSNGMKEVFRFLDNETSIVQELKIIRRLPKGIFLKAALGF